MAALPPVAARRLRDVKHTAAGTRGGTVASMPPMGDEALAKAAVAGDCAAFAELYDRHEHRAFNLAYRICGTREDAADATQDAFVKVLVRLPAMAGRKLDFGSYLLTAVRHASYDVIAAGRRAAPVGDVPAAARPVGTGTPPPEEDPDRRVLLAAQQEEIRAANATLPPRQREALALRELEGLSYDEIAGLMGMNRNSVAQLISRARIGLRDALRRTALQSIVPASPACERALAMLAMRDDGEPVAYGLWLDEHLAGCETCVLAREAMAEAGASYRAWAPIPALEVLRRETIAHAGEFVGRHWCAPARSRRILLRRRLRRDTLAGAAAGVVLLLAVLAPHTREGAVVAQDAPSQAAVAVAEPRAARAVARPAKARRVTAPVATARAAVPAATPQPAGQSVAAAARPAPKPAAAAERPAPRPRVRSVPARRQTPAQTADPASVQQTAPPEDRPADTVPPLPPQPPPPPPPPPPRPVVTNFVAPPPPPSSIPREPAPRRPSGGSSGVPVP